ncbi:MAG: porin [Puniceicoccales bacterium]|jgi:hypothetical protein|nr:porin [Puniceicoccales bacterium]
MNTLLKTTALSAMLTAAAALPSMADVQVPNTYLTIDGYVASSATISKDDSANRDYSLFDSQNRGLDAVKFGVKAEYQGFSAYVSALYIPEGTNKKRFDEAGILDAYVSYEIKNGDNKFNFRAGKFVTDFGFESFHTVNNAFMTAGYWSGGDWWLAPAYHSGIRAEFSNSNFTIGGSIVDSLAAGRGFYEGDGDLHNVGFEVFAKYTGIQGLTVFAGVGFDSKNDEGLGIGFGGSAIQFYQKKHVLVDVWARYEINQNFNIGAEFLFEDMKFAASGLGSASPRPHYTWIIFGEFINTGTLFSPGDRFSVAARVSGKRLDEGAGISGYHDSYSEYQLSLAPTYKLNENLSFRIEGSVRNGEGGYDAWFIGAQVLLKF